MRLSAIFKAYFGERAWKTIRYMLRRPCYLSRVVHVRRIRNRKQRMAIGKYSFVNWNQLPAEALRTVHCKPKIVRKSVGKAIINVVKQKEQKCGENRLKVQ